MKSLKKINIRFDCKSHFKFLPFFLTLVSFALSYQCFAQKHSETMLVPFGLSTQEDSLVFQLNTKQIYEQLKNTQQEKTYFSLCLNDKQCWKLELVRKNVLADGSTISIIKNGKSEVFTVSDYHVLGGKIVGDDDSKVSIILSPFQARIRFSTQGVNYSIMPVVGKNRQPLNNQYKINSRKKKVNANQEKAISLVECDGCNGGLCPDCYLPAPGRTCFDAVNNNGITCETIPLYDFDDFEWLPDVEVAGDADNEFFLLYSNGLSNPDHPSLDDGVFMSVLDPLSIVQENYFTYFSTSIVLVHLNIWATPDGYNNSDNQTLLNSLESYWNSNKSCIHRDLVHLFSGAEVENDGASKGDVCQEDGAFSYSEHNNGSIMRRAKTVTHEIGHHLGANHDDTRMCCQLKFNTPNVVMFTSDNSDEDNELVWSEVSQFDVKKFLSEPNREACLTGVVTSFELECEEACLAVIAITGDNPIPQPNCGENDIINFELQVCNYCDEAMDWELSAKFTTQTMQVEDLGNFTSEQQEGLFTVITGESVSLAPGICTTFHFTGRVINLPSSGLLGVRPFINDEDYSQYQFSIPVISFSNTIGGTNNQSLLGLINTTPVFLMPPDGCGGCTTPNCKDKNILQKLLVDVDYCMDGFNFKMNPGAEIVVQSGRTLTIKNSKLFACSTQWKGITVEDGATLIMENCTVEDAQYGVHAYGGGTLSLTGNKFKNNFIGVFVDGPIPAYAGNTSFDAFSGNTFDGAGGLLPPYPGQSSVPASGAGGAAFAGLWVQTHAETINSYQNTFKNLSNGIYVNQTNLSVIGCNFLNISENGFGDWEAGYGIRGIDNTKAFAYHFVCTGFGANSENFSFYNCSKGIRIVGMNVGKINRNAIDAIKGIELVNCYPQAFVFSNSITTYERGITFSHMLPGTDANILYNKIRADEANAIGIQANMMGVEPLGVNGIKLRLNEIYLKKSGTRGIESNSGNKLTINENTVIGLEPMAAKITGIRINNDQNSYVLCNTVTSPFAGGPNGSSALLVWDGEQTKYNCNALSNMTTGVSFNMGSLSPENFAETSISSCKTGLFVAATATTGPQSHRGNKWMGGFANFGAQHGSSNPSDWELSKFTVHTFSGTYRPSLPLGQNFWFNTEISGTPSNICPVCLPPNPPDDDEEELYPIPDGPIANGGFTTASNGTEIKKLAERYLYRKLAEHPELVTTGSVYEAFYNAQANTNIGKFRAVENGIQGLYAANSLAEVIVRSNFEAIGTKMDEVAALDSLIVLGGSGTPSLQQQRKLAVQNIGVLTASNSSLMLPLLAQRATAAATVLAQNNAISTLPSNVSDWNEREVNRIFLSSVAIGQTAFNISDLASLENIAYQCPLTGGSAVFKARSLLALVTDTNYDDDELCQPVQQRQNPIISGIENVPIFQVFPNPASNEITIVLAKGAVAEGEMTISIYNSLGLSVLNKVIPEKSNHFSVTVSELGEGIHLVSLHKGNVQIGTQKILINR